MTCGFMFALIRAEPPLLISPFAIRLQSGPL